MQRGVHAFLPGWIDSGPVLLTVRRLDLHLPHLQDLGDMNLIVTALKQKLAPFGWAEAVRRDHKSPGAVVTAVSSREAACPALACSCVCMPLQRCLGIAGGLYGVEQSTARSWVAWPSRSDSTKSD